MIILPNKERRVVDPGCRGTVVVEAEGTNEELADLHVRCRGEFSSAGGMCFMNAGAYDISEHQRFAELASL